MFASERSERSNMSPHPLELASIVAGIFGTIFLGREVYKGHRFEEASATIASLERDDLRYQELERLLVSHQREFLIQAQIDFAHLSPEKAEGFVGSLTGAEFSKTIADWTSHLKGLMPGFHATLKSKRDWFRETHAPAQLAGRQRLLLLGFVLLMLGAGLHLASVLADGH